MGQRLNGGSARATRQARTEIRSRLEARRSEIEQATLTRVYGIADPGAADPGYLEGLRAAVSAALDYGLAAIERGEEREPPIPTTLLGQARIAARNGVSLDTVLRRYFAGYSLFGYFLVEEATGDGLIGGAELQRLLGMQATLFDRLLAAISEEHGRESEQRLDTAGERRAQLVQRLLEGELVDASELAYELDVDHVGLIASGPGAQEAVRDLARALDRRLLLVCPAEDVVWAWLGSRKETDFEEIEQILSASWPSRALLAIGEPGEGLAGWRLSHRQAVAAMPIAQRGPECIVRYADVALLASILRDELLRTSLRRLYLEPLERERDGGDAARDTLRAYFAAERNISSASAMLGVSRQAVAKRLRSVEERIGRSLADCSTELDAALRLEASTFPVSCDSQPRRPGGHHTGSEGPLADRRG